jgi:hypothetical protein
MLGVHLVSMTLHRGLKLVLSKTIKLDLVTLNIIFGLVPRTWCTVRPTVGDPILA